MTNPFSPGQPLWMIPWRRRSASKAVGVYGEVGYTSYVPFDWAGLPVCGKDAQSLLDGDNNGLPVWPTFDDTGIPGGTPGGDIGFPLATPRAVVCYGFNLAGSPAWAALLAGATGTYLTRKRVRVQAAAPQFSGGGGGAVNALSATTPLMEPVAVASGFGAGTILAGKTYAERFAGGEVLHLINASALVASSPGYLVITDPAAGAGTVNDALAGLDQANVGAAAASYLRVKTVFWRITRGDDFDNFGALADGIVGGIPAAANAEVRVIHANDVGLSLSGEPAVSDFATIITSFFGA